MHICYIDESGVPEIGQGTSHFVLVGLAIRAWNWKEQDAKINALRRKYALVDAEIHTGWMTRRFLEQERIANFDKMDWPARRLAVKKERERILIRAVALKGPNAIIETRKNFRKTEAYIHLTREQRMEFLRGVADLIGGWGNARLFAEAIDKTSFGATPPAVPPREEAFGHVVNRFERFLEGQGPTSVGLIAHDHDQTSEDRLLALMRRFHASGTMWTHIKRIVETPFFVDSRLTGGIQLADLCAYATRRYCEYRETDLFDRIYPRFHRDRRTVVGLRHYVGTRLCNCKICTDHPRATASAIRRP